MKPLNTQKTGIPTRSGIYYCLWKQNTQIHWTDRNLSITCTNNYKSSFGSVTATLLYNPWWTHTSIEAEKRKTVCFSIEQFVSQTHWWKSELLPKEKRIESSLFPFGWFQKNPSTFERYNWGNLDMVKQLIPYIMNENEN